MKISWKIFAVSVLGVGLLLGLCGCLGDDDDDDDVLAYLLLNQATDFSYAAAMQECTPYLGSSGNLNAWANGWRVGDGYGLFEKMLADGSEGLYGPVETLDNIIQMIDGAASVWNGATADGSDTISTGGENMTVTVDVDLVSVDEIPGFGALATAFAVDHHIKIVTADKTIVAAFTDEGANEKLAAYMQNEASASATEYLGIYANRNQTDGFVEVWIAVYVDYTNPATDDYAMRYKWRGFPDAAEPWFMLSQYTNACNGDQVVLGGGPRDGTMGFIAENGDQGLTDTWYCYVTYANIDGTSAGSVTDASVTAPTTASAPGQYINVALNGHAGQVANDRDIPAVSAYCYDWLSDHPANVAAIAGTGVADDLWTGSLAFDLP